MDACFWSISEYFRPAILNSRSIWSIGPFLGPKMGFFWEFLIFFYLFCFQPAILTSFPELVRIFSIYMQIKHLKLTLSGDWLEKTNGSKRYIFWKILKWINVKITRNRSDAGLWKISFLKWCFFWFRWSLTAKKA